jgi:hypothetical protein
MQNLKTTLSLLAVAGTLAAVSPAAHADGDGDAAVNWAEAALKAVANVVKIDVKITDKGIKHLSNAVVMCSTSKNATILVSGCVAAGVMFAGAYCYKMVNTPSPGGGGKAQASNPTATDVTLAVKYEDKDSGTKVDSSVDVFEIDASVQKLLQPIHSCSN